MVRYSPGTLTNQKFSLCELSGAIALGIAHDIQTNLLSFNCFPLVDCKIATNGNYSASIEIDEVKVGFEITRDEAKLAVQKFKSGQHCNEIFKRIQDALVILEQKMSQQISSQ